MLFLCCWLAHGAISQGNYVFTGAEAANFGIIDLATPGGQTWATDRLATPGYFSAVGASPYNSASDAANVNGYVKMYTTAANQGYTFPVGSGTDLRSLTTSGTIANGSSFATAWILGDPSGNLDPTTPNSGAHNTISVGSGIVVVSKIGQWDWQDLTGTSNGVTITVSIPDVTALSYTTGLRLVGWNGTQWQNLSTGTPPYALNGVPSYATKNFENSSLTGTMVSGITAIGIGTTSTLLPLELQSFTIAESNCAANLTWITASEVSTSYFEVQQSTDGSSFATKAKVNAKGTGSSSYAFTAAQSIGIAYYRLKMVDKDGTFKYSPIASLRTSCSNTANYIKLYPNPVVTGNGQVTLSFSLGYKGNATIKVTDVQGRLVISNRIAAQDGPNQYSFSSSTLAKGIYYVQLISADGSLLGSAQKLVKQ